MPDWGQGTWFYRYISPPLREVLDAGPEVDKLLRRPRLISACVMFTDIRGFTALSRSIDPNRLVDTLNLHMAQQARSLEQFGGYIENFKGDGLMAVFEGEAMEARACHCALDILDGARRPPATAYPCRWVSASIPARWCGPASVVNAGGFTEASAPWSIPPPGSVITPAARRFWPADQ